MLSYTVTQTPSYNGTVPCGRSQDNGYDSVFTQNTHNFNLLGFVDFIDFIPLFSGVGNISLLYV